MPGVTIWMLRLSLGYLIAGLGIGALILMNKAVLFAGSVWLWLPVHIEILIFGWIIQFTLGTAYWILPRYFETGDRGHPSYGILMVVFLNTGILLTAFSGFTGHPALFSLTGRLLEALSAGLFAALHWKRIATYRDR